MPLKQGTSKKRNEHRAHQTHPPRHSAAELPGHRPLDPLHFKNRVPTPPRLPPTFLSDRLLGVPLVAAHRLFLDPATISVVDWSGGATDWPAPAVLRLFNAHYHLGWTAARWLQAEAE